MTPPTTNHIVTVREYKIMQYTATDIGQIVRQARKTMGVTQKELALTAGTGLRFIIELEQGKPTCQLEKTLRVVHTLGIRIDLTPPQTTEPEA